MQEARANTPQGPPRAPFLYAAAGCKARTAEKGGGPFLRPPRNSPSGRHLTRRLLLCTLYYNPRFALYNPLFRAIIKVMR